MAIFTIADTHLSLHDTVNKPMDVFGSRWVGYTEKLEKGWRETVRDGDTVVIPGDISWAMTLDESLCDLRFLNGLPGSKIIGRGNHDYWWATKKKMDAFLTENSLDTIKFLYNNAFAVEDMNLCGSRGWYPDEKGAPKTADYDKIVAREAVRLRLSFEYAKAIEGGENRENVAFLHFPPYFGDYKCPELLDVLHEYGVTLCFYGHIHSRYELPQVEECEGIEFVLISADFLNFIPQRVN